MEIILTPHSIPLLLFVLVFIIQIPIVCYYFKRRNHCGLRYRYPHLISICACLAIAHIIPRLLDSAMNFNQPVFKIIAHVSFQLGCGLYCVAHIMQYSSLIMINLLNYDDRLRLVDPQIRRLKRLLRWENCGCFCLLSMVIWTLPEVLIVSAQKRGESIGTGLVDCLATIQITLLMSGNIFLSQHMQTVVDIFGFWDCFRNTGKYTFVLVGPFAFHALVQPFFPWLQQFYIAEVLSAMIALVFLFFHVIVPLTQLNQPEFDTTFMGKTRGKKLFIAYLKTADGLNDFCEFLNEESNEPHYSIALVELLTYPQFDTDESRRQAAARIYENYIQKSTALQVKIPELIRRQYMANYTGRLQFSKAFFMELQDYVIKTLPFTMLHRFERDPLGQSWAKFITVNSAKRHLEIVQQISRRNVNSSGSILRHQRTKVESFIT